LDVTVVAGTSTATSAAFTAAKKLPNVTISDGGATASFVTETPASLMSAPAGTPVTVTFTVAVPGATSLGDYVGSVVVSSGRKVVADSLPVTVHVVAPTGHIYWTNASVGIGRADRQGLNADGAFIPSSVMGNPVGIAVDGQHIYWSDANSQCANGVGVCPKIGRANLDGSNPNKDFIVFPTDIGYPLDVAVNDQYIYWAWNGNSGSSIGRANLDGSNATTAFVSTGALLPYGIALDSTRIYWAGQASGGGGSIGRAYLDGSSAEYFIGPLLALAPIGVAVDSKYVYWTEQNDQVTGSIGRADLDGSNPNALFVTDSTVPFSVAVDADYIYWTRAAGSIGRALADGSDGDPSFIGAPAFFIDVGN